MAALLKQKKKEKFDFCKCLPRHASFSPILVALAYRRSSWLILHLLGSPSFTHLQIPNQKSSIANFYGPFKINPRLLANKKQFYLKFRKYAQLGQTRQICL